MTLNDSNDVICTVPVFAENEAVLFPGIRERIMTGIPGRPGNGSPGMHSLVFCLVLQWVRDSFNILCSVESTTVQCLFAIFLIRYLVAIFNFLIDFQYSPVASYLRC